MNGTLRGTVYGYSLWEFEMYAPRSPATSITSGKTYRIDAKSSLLSASVENASTTNGAKVINGIMAQGEMTNGRLRRLPQDITRLLTCIAASPWLLKMHPRWMEQL
jgi:hypothetical protein